MSGYENTLLDFDLDFLHQATKKSVTPEKPTERSDRSRKSVSIAKKKIIATDSLIRKYYERKDEVDQMEKTLSISKEEYKQTCIEFKNMVEKCTIKEQEAQMLRCSNVELQEKYEHAQNVVCAMQSHANQLQNLVKQNESTIESLTIENKLHKANAKDYEKKFMTIQKENEELLRNICLVRDAVFGKKKLKKHQKEILLKYKKENESDDNDSLFGDDSIGHDTDTENDFTLVSPEGKSKLHTTPKETPQKGTIKGEYISLKDDNGHDSDCSNELASADTGRGSSLAFSDGEKCFNSPDYYITHSPLTADAGQPSKKVVSTGTSPIHFIENTSVATSPVFQYEDIQITLSPLSSHNVEEDKECIALSPILPSEAAIDESHAELQSNSPIEVSTVITPVISDPQSDICIDEETTISSPIIIPGGNQTTNSRLNNSATISERECLELNNSGNLDVNDTGDSEIEMILHKMRLHHTLLTPIPNSPSKSARSSTVSKVTHEIDDIVCKEAEKIREENKILNEKLSELAQEIVNIKDILRDKDLLNNNRQININITESSLNPVSSNHEITETQNHTPKSKKECKKRHKSGNKLSIIQNLSHQPVNDSQNTSEEYECFDTSSNNNLTSNESSPMTRLNVSCSVKETAKLNRVDTCEIDGILPLSPINNTIEPINSNCINSLPQDLKANTLKNMCSADGTDKSLPLSSMLEFEREPSPDVEARNEILLSEASPRDKQNVTELAVKNSKPRKLSKLEKMRTKLLPKSKIKNVSSLPIKKLRTRPIQLPVLPKQVTPNDNSASLNDKDVYEKALKVMSELKSKEQSRKINSPCKSKLRSKRVNRDLVGNESNNDKNSPCKDKNSPCKDKDLTSVDINNKDKSLDDDAIDKCGKESIVAVVKCNELDSPSAYPKQLIATRSRSKLIEELNISPENITIPEKDNSVPNKQAEKSSEISSDVNEESVRQGSRKRPKRASIDKPEIQCKRMLRSSTLRRSKSEEDASLNLDTVSNSEIVPIASKTRPVSDSKEIVPNAETRTVSNSIIVSNDKTKDTKKVLDNSILNKNDTPNEVLSYNDIDMFTNDKTSPSKPSDEEKEKRASLKDSILCAMVDKFAKRSAKNFSKKLPDKIIASTSKTLQQEIAKISELPPNETNHAMNKLVDIILNWGYKQFMAGFMAYLTAPERKIELFNKISSPPAPPMTKAEQILLFVISKLRACWSSVDFVDCTLCNIEYMLFRINRTPEFDTIESASHFYAVLCRYFKMKSRLRVFMLDAMYCIQFKAVPLIKQCLDVWMHVLPLAHMGIAKCPLVTCMVYLLHFYKCEDRFNRVQEIRNILNRKYFYEITDWNEPKIIEMFKNAINNVRASPMERKLLRIALIVIAKRHAPRWCQNNIIKKILLPAIESNAPEKVKIFCVSLLGPLLKPYPVDMKVHCEIVMNQLLDILKQNPSPLMEEAIFTSLIYMSKHNFTRVIQSLLAWNPQQISPELERLMRDFVREKPLKVWRTALAKIPLA